MKAMMPLACVICGAAADKTRLGAFHKQCFCAQLAGIVDGRQRQGEKTVDKDWSLSDSCWRCLHGLAVTDDAGRLCERCYCRTSPLLLLLLLLNFRLIHHRQTSAVPLPSALTAAIATRLTNMPVPLAVQRYACQKNPHRKTSADFWVGICTAVPFCKNVERENAKESSYLRWTYSICHKFQYLKKSYTLLFNFRISIYVNHCARILSHTERRILLLNDDLIDNPVVMNMEPIPPGNHNSMHHSVCRVWKGELFCKLSEFSTCLFIVCHRNDTNISSIYKQTHVQ